MVPSGFCTCGEPFHEGPCATKGSYDNAFARWFTGFFDGEGSFCVYFSTKTKQYNCRIALGQRSDNAIPVFMIHHRLGVGTLSLSKRSRARRRHQVIWAVYAKHEIPLILAFFRKYPPIGKKAVEFPIFCDAYAAWVAGDFKTMKACSKKLKDLRRYRPVEFKREPKKFMASPKLSRFDPSKAVPHFVVGRPKKARATNS
jgi:hypothetical protein